MQIRHSRDHTRARNGAKERLPAHKRTTIRSWTATNKKTHPLIWAQRSVPPLELGTLWIARILGRRTRMKLKIASPAVLGLVRGWKPPVHGRCAHSHRHFRAFRHSGSTVQHVRQLGREEGNEERRNEEEHRLQYETETAARAKRAMQTQSK